MVSVALVLTINGVSLRERPCQTMQRPVELKAQGRWLAAKPGGSNFPSVTTRINLKTPQSWTEGGRRTPAMREERERVVGAGGGEGGGGGDSVCWNRTKRGFFSFSVVLPTVSHGVAVCINLPSRSGL